MALELRLVGGDVLDPDAIFVAARLDDAIDEQKRIAMRQERKQLLDVEAFDRRAPPSRSFRSPSSRSVPAAARSCRPFSRPRPGRAASFLHRGRPSRKNCAHRSSPARRPSARPAGIVMHHPRRPPQSARRRRSSDAPSRPAWPPSAAKSPMTVDPETPDWETRTQWRPIDDVVADLHEIVDLGAFADDRVAIGAAVDRRPGADLDVVLDDDAADLRHFQMALRGPSAKPNPSWPICAPGWMMTRSPIRARGDGRRARRRRRCARCARRDR